MKINTPNCPVAQVTNNRARQILAALGRSLAEPELVQQVETFVRCNGYYEVLGAARFTAKQAQREKIDDPWAYTISVYNGNVARLNHLHMLTHWVENALRSQLDLYYVGARGTDWHLYPDEYLPLQSVDAFLKAHASMGITSCIVPGSASSRPRSKIVQPTAAGDYLHMVTFGWLLTMVRHLHKQNRGSHILVKPSGQATSRQEVQRLLNSAKEARNAVAHHHYVPEGRYTGYLKDVVTLLQILHFDVAKALQRTNTARHAVVEEHMRELEQRQTPRW